ncbi:MAG: hypothetical protein JW818_00505 [Pirellulales bacterium]|nr:hypothetical protein [Pirellulales bacterium]
MDRRKVWPVRRVLGVCLAVILCGLLLPAARAQDDNAEGERKRLGRSLKITLPITAQTQNRVERFVERTLTEARQKQFQPVLIFELTVPPGQEDFGQGSPLGVTSDLAKFLSGETTTAAHTVAYIPQPIQGHAVLLAMACDEIIMSPEASIGSAGIDEKIIDESILQTYRQIASRRRTVPVELALGMVDPSREVFEVETDVEGTKFVTPKELEELRKVQTIKRGPDKIVSAGEAAQFTAEQARKLGFVSALASNRTELARALGLPPEAVEEDLRLADAWKAVRIDLRLPINADQIDKAQRLIDDAIAKQGANFICLWIDSAGGSPADSMRLATHLALDLPRDKVRTVAYVPGLARSDAALIALGCDQIVLGPNAVLGGLGNHTFTREEIATYGDMIRQKLAPAKSRSWSLPLAMIDPNLEVFRYSRQGVDEYFCEAEWKEQPAHEEWVKGPMVEKELRGEPFKAKGAEAITYRLADHVVDNFTQFREIYGLEDDPALSELSWADVLVDALKHRGVGILLVILGFTALYFEFHVPGVGIGGFVAMVCFLLFFWGQFLGGTAGVLEIILFLAGVACILLEIFVFPGFGIFGLGGGALVIGSLVLASQTFIWPQNRYQMAEFQSSLMMVGGAIVGIVALAVLMNRWLPQAPVLGKVMLNPLSADEKEQLHRSESLVDYVDLVGQRGITTTQLTPSGKARFGDRLVDVISDSELIEPNVAIVVVEVHGSRVMVEPVDPA